MVEKGKPIPTGNAHSGFGFIAGAIGIVAGLALLLVF